MRTFATPTRLGFFFALTTAASLAGVVHSEFEARADRATGADMASDCVNCVNRSKAWGECFHLNLQPPPKATACEDDRCIQNFDAWTECNPKPPSGTGNCDTHNDPNATRTSQTAYKPAAKLDCGKDPGDLLPVPADVMPAPGDCNTVIKGSDGKGVKGKCIITCGGELLDVGSITKGMLVCGK